MFIYLNSYYVDLSPVNLNTTHMEQNHKFKLFSNLSLRRFFLNTKKFCDGYDLCTSSLGRVKLVSYSKDGTHIYESKIYSSMKAFYNALNQHLNYVLK